MRTTKVAAVVALALLAAMLAVGVAWAAPGDTDPTLGASAELRKAVEPAGILVRSVNHRRRPQHRPLCLGGDETVPGAHQKSLRRTRMVSPGVARAFTKSIR